MTVTAERITPWTLVKETAFTTVGKEPKDSEPTSEWKRKILKCEHSPIRTLMFVLRFRDLPYFVSVHLVRHKIGVEHFVRSQRSDRSIDGASRHDLPQDAPVEHTMVLNAAAIIFMSRRRLCGQASKETREAWGAAVQALRDIGEVELADSCVPECVYRGACPEMRPCK